MSFQSQQAVAIAGVYSSQHAIVTYLCGINPKQSRACLWVLWKSQVNFWSGPSAEMCWGFSFSMLEDLPGIFLEDFSGHLIFPHKKPAAKSAKKSGGPKIEIRENSVLPRTDPNKLQSQTIARFLCTLVNKFLDRVLAGMA